MNPFSKLTLILYVCFHKKNPRKLIEKLITYFVHLQDPQKPKNLRPIRQMIFRTAKLQSAELTELK